MLVGHGTSVSRTHCGRRPTRHHDTPALCFSVVKGEVNLTSFQTCAPQLGPVEGRSCDLEHPVPRPSRDKEFWANWGLHHIRNYGKRLKPQIPQG